MSEQLAWDGSSTVGVSTNAEAPTDPSVKKEYTIGCYMRMIGSTSMKL